MTATSPPSRRRALVVASLGATVALAAAGCGEPLPELAPGQSPAAYSGLEVSDDRVEYAIGKVADIVEEELEASGVPGAAVAVVHNGETALAEGFGVRDTVDGDAVDENTVFPLASLSKPVSATVVAAEAAGGDVDWSTPVREHLPWFALADPAISPLVTVGDLFAHRSGLPEHAGDDLEDLGYDRPAILHGLRHLPLTPFRTSYAYTNFGLTAGAEAVAVAAGTPWAELARERVFGPLGMSATSYSHDDLLALENRAVGHVRAIEAGADANGAGTNGAAAPDADSDTGDTDSDADTNGDTDSDAVATGAWVPADPARDPDTQAPAGGLSSSATDMARWMAMVLADGKGSDGTQIADPVALREALTPQSVAAPPQSAADRPGTYGYGFDVGTSSSGRVQWSHSGAFTLGAGTSMLMLPSLGLGIVTLTNASPVGVAETVNARFADLAQYGDPALNWRDLYGQALGDLLDPVGDLVGARQPAAPRPPRPLGELVGTYRNDYFGEVEIRRAAAPSGEGSGGSEAESGGSEAESGGSEGSGPSLELVLGRGPRVWPLEHWDGDTFAASPVGENWPPGSRGAVMFDDDEVTVSLLDGDGLGTFTRAGAGDDPAGPADPASPADPADPGA